MRKITLSLVLVGCTLLSRASLTEVWSNAFTPSIPNIQSSSWNKGVVNPADNSIILLGSAFDDNDASSVLQRLSPSGALIWTSPVLPGVFLSDVTLDAAGNVFACGATTAGKFIVSLDGATGAVRFSQTYGLGGFSSIVVKKISSTTTLVFAAGNNRVGQGQPVLTRVNPVTGALVSEAAVPSSSKSGFAKVVTDANGNPVAVGTVQPPGGAKSAFVVKFSISLNQVWRQEFPESGALPGVGSDEVTLLPTGEVAINVLLGLNTQFPVIRAVKLNGSNGSILSDETVTNSIPFAQRSFLRVAPSNRLVRAFAGSDVTGNNISSLIQILSAGGLPDFQTNLGTSKFNDIAVDASSQLMIALANGESSFEYVREPAAGSVTINASGSFCQGVMVDGENRVISFGQLNGQTFVRQDQQGLDVNDDTYFGLFPSTLSIPAPGVLANDAFHVGAPPVLVNPPTHGTVALDADGSFDYTAAQSLPADDSFTYKVSKGGFTSFGTVNLRAVKLDNLEFSGSSVIGGTKVQTRIFLNHPAPIPVVASLTTTNPALIPPPTATITAGADQVGFLCNTTMVTANTNAILNATFQNVTLVKSIVIRAGALLALSATTTEIIGGEISGQQDVISYRAILNAPASQTVTLSVVATGSLVSPTSLSIPAGAGFGNFIVKANEVGAITQESVTVRQGSLFFTLPATVHPKPRLQFFTLSKSTVIGGASLTGRATLTGKASVQMNPFVLQVLETSASVTTPLTISVAPGTDTVTFDIATQVVTADQGVSIKVKRDLVTITNLLVLIPNPLDSVIVTPSTLQGGNSAQGEVKLNNLAPPGNLVVLLSSSSNALKVPSSVKVLAGSWSGPFAITTLGVASPFNVTVTARLQGRVRTATVRLLP